MTEGTPLEHPQPGTSPRDEFLLKMYDLMWQNINRHILVVWQSIAALFTAIAAAFLSDKNLLSPDYGISLVVLAAAWSVAHAIDASAWFNRNLLIVRNIERQFLIASDATEIHYFFVEKPRTGILDHLAIQLTLAGSIWLLALLFHFLTRIVPGFSLPLADLDPTRALPYLSGLVALFVVMWFKAKVGTHEAKLIQRSPGRPVRLSATNL